MFNLALTAVNSELENIDISGSPLIQKYGKAVFPLTIKTPVGTTPSGEPILKEKTYPVAPDVNFEACVINGKYQELVPNSKYRSIAYWEQLGGGVVNASESSKLHKNYKVIDFPCRLIVWLNNPKMNLNGTEAGTTDIAPMVAMKVMDVLSSKKWFEVPDANYGNPKVNFDFRGQEVKDVRKVFGKYSYESHVQAFMLYPYSFFSLRYVCRMRVNTKCLAAFTLGAPQDCEIKL